MHWVRSLIFHLRNVHRLIHFYIVVNIYTSSAIYTFTQFNRSIRLSFNENPKTLSSEELLCMFEWKLSINIRICRRRIEIYRCDYPMNFGFNLVTYETLHKHIEGMVNEYVHLNIFKCGVHNSKVYNFSVSFFYYSVLTFYVNEQKKKRVVMIVLQETTTHIYTWCMDIMWFIQGRCVQIVIIVIHLWMRTWHIITTLLSHIPHSKCTHNSFFYITKKTTTRNKNHNRLIIYVDDLLYMANIKREKCNFLTRLDNGALRYMWNIPYNKLHAWWTSM